MNPSSEWREGYDRVIALVHEAGDAGLAVTVPACPDWTARDLVAHMIGVGVDSVAGDAPEDNNPGWTRQHIEQRPGGSADLLAEWARNADSIEKFVGENPAPLADLLIHEQDLRGALGVSGARDADGQDFVRTAMLGQLGDVLPEPPLRLQATDSDWSWQSGDGVPGAVVAAPLYDLTRGLCSRRTAEQLRGFTLSGSVDPYLDALAVVGPLPEKALKE